jgi:hypothetical protein
MTKWEYRLVAIPDSEDDKDGYTLKVLQGQGSQGFELVSAVLEPNIPGPVRMLYFKRPAH